MATCFAHYWVSKPIRVSCTQQLHRNICHEERNNMHFKCTVWARENLQLVLTTLWKWYSPLERTVLRDLHFVNEFGVFCCCCLLVILVYFETFKRWCLLGGNRKTVCYPIRRNINCDELCKPSSILVTEIYMLLGLHIMFIKFLEI